MGHWRLEEFFSWLFWFLRRSGAVISVSVKVEFRADAFKMVIFIFIFLLAVFVVLLATLSEVTIYTKILLYCFLAYWLVICIATSYQYGTAYSKCP